MKGITLYVSKNSNVRGHLKNEFRLVQGRKRGKEWRLKKETTFAFGQFTTISGHFFCQIHKYLSQYLSSDGHFEGLNMS